MPTTPSALAQACIARLLKREGTLSDRASDRGGYTKYGITIPTLSKYLNRPATRNDIMALTPETTVDIYWKIFWLGNHIDRLEFSWVELAEFLFDWGVNSGPSGLQKFQDWLGVTPDGVIGQETVAALAVRLRQRGIKNAFNDLVDYRIIFCLHICQKDPSQVDNIVGWFNRINSFRQY